MRKLGWRSVDLTYFWIPKVARDPCNKSNWHILDEKGVFYEPAKPDGSLSQINIFSQFQKIRGD